MCAFVRLRRLSVLRILDHIMQASFPLKQCKWPALVVIPNGKDGKKPASLIADTTTANAQVRSLSAQAPGRS